MLKRILAAIIGLIVLAVVLVVVAVDALARAAIEEGGSAALGVETQLDSADVGLFSGHFALDGLTVQNPTGFGSEHFLSLDSGVLDVSLGSLLSDRVEASLLQLDGAFIAIERDGTDTNYGVILENLESVGPVSTKDGSESKSKDAGRAAKTFVIDRILIRNVEAKLVLGIAGASTDTTLEITEIDLDGLDSREFTLEELVSFIVRAILEYAATAEGGLVPADIAGDLKKQLSGFGDVRFDLEGKTVDDIRAMGDELKDAGKALKNLLGGDE